MFYGKREKAWISEETVRGSLNDWFKGFLSFSLDPINEYDLLNLVAEIYSKNIEVIEDVEFIIYRSPGSSKFREATGFSRRPWNDLLLTMHEVR